MDGFYLYIMAHRMWFGSTVCNLGSQTGCVRLVHSGERGYCRSTNYLHPKGHFLRSNQKQWSRCPLVAVCCHWPKTNCHMSRSVDFLHRHNNQSSNIFLHSALFKSTLKTWFLTSLYIKFHLKKISTESTESDPEIILTLCKYVNIE